MPARDKVIEIEATHAFPERLWAGSQDSLVMAVRAHAAIQAAMLAGGLSQREDDTEPLPYLLTKSGSVGIIAINGLLVNEDSRYNKYYGITSYQDIRRAAIAAAADPSIKAIALDVGSPGGAVSGVEDTASLFDKINKEVKPIYAFSGSTIASAGIWVASPARRLEVGPATLAGSIGVLAVHTEYTKMYDEIGIKKTVIRAGEFKALANQNEVLDEKAAAQLQAQVDQTYKVFMGRVASSLKLDYAKADSTVGQGREFVGQAAVDVGLAARVTSFDEFITRIQSALDKSASAEQNATKPNRGFPTMPRAALTQAQIEAMRSAGIDQSAIDAMMASETGELPANTPALPPVAAPAAPAPAAPAASAPAAQTPVPDPMSALLDRLTAANTNLTQANAKAEALAAEVAVLKSQTEKMRGVVETSVKAMAVAMNTPAKDYSKVDVDALIGEHDTSKKAFEAMFPGGQVSASSSSEANKGQAPAWLDLAARTSKT